MKHLYVLFLGLIAFGGQAQIINFPDPDFKAAILTNPYNQGVDADNDGEITQAEAAAAFSLTLTGSAIDNLDGLQYFTGLSNFYLYNTSVASLTLPAAITYSNGYNEVVISGNFLLNSITWNATENVNMLTISSNNSLQQFSLANLTAITTQFVVSTNSGLTDFSLPDVTEVNGEFQVTGNSLLNTIHFPLLETTSDFDEFRIQNNPNLTSLDLSSKSLGNVVIEDNGLTSINLGGTTCTGYNFSLADNQLTTLDLSTFSATGYNTVVNLSGNNYADLTLSGPWSSQTNTMTSARPSLYLDHTNLTSISFDPQLLLSSLYVRDNLQLESLNFRNESFETCPGGYCAIQGFAISNNPALNLVCTDAFEVYSIMQENYVSGPDWVHQNIDPDVMVSINCFYDPPGNFNMAAGFVRYDADGNGCSASDAVIPFVPIATSNNNNQSTAYANGLGGYYATTSGTAITLTPTLNSNYFNVSPASANLTFTGYGNYQTADFCVTANGVHNDLAVDVVPMDNARPGFDTKYRIVYRNQGTTIQSGTVSAGFWTTQEFVSASVAPASQSAGNLVWNFSNLLPFETRTIDVILNVNSPLETPAVNDGDTVSLSASVVAATDETQSDNSDSCTKTVVNSFDPNDKQVSQGSVTLLGQTFTDGLTYTIRFQNTGSANADRVVITDVLDSDFDLTSVQPIASSHPMKMRRLENLLEFWFEDIDLPYESANEPASHGFVTYNVKATQWNDSAAIYENTANIYFDYNLPIVTNTTETTVVELGAPDKGLAKVKVFPNPAKNLVNVISETGLPLKAEIFSLSGQLLLKSASAQNHSLDVSKLATGTYLIKLSSENGSQTQKLVKY